MHLICLTTAVLSSLSDFLQVERGEFTDSEIIVMLGENGTGKTTFIRMLAGMLKPGRWLMCVGVVVVLVGGSVEFIRGRCCSKRMRQVNQCQDFEWHP